MGMDRRVTVVGAGFSGLASAFYLVRVGYRVEVIEAQERAGGLIATTEFPEGRVESAANGLLNSALVEDLFETVGLAILPTKKSSKRRFIFRDGRPRRWPLGLGATLGLVGFVLRFLFVRKSVQPKEAEPVSVWGARAMGAEASRYTIETALQGIYAGDAAKMSARLIVGRFFGLRPKQSAAKLPNRKPKIRGTVSAPEGMGQLIAHMRAYLEKQGVVFRFGQPFSFENGGLGSAFKNEGSIPRVDHPVIVATSASAAAQLLAGTDPDRSKALSEIELLPVLTTTVFFKRPIESAQGFGCLFPPTEGKPMLGVLMNSFIFDGRARQGFSETWIFGGAHGATRTPRLFEMQDQEILNLVDQERSTCFRAQSERMNYKITRWPTALPHYTVALEKRLPVLLEPRQNVWLVGNYLGQIGLAKILESAAELPAQLAQKGSWT